MSQQLPVATAAAPMTTAPRDFGWVGGTARPRARLLRSASVPRHPVLDDEEGDRQGRHDCDHGHRWSPPTSAGTREPRAGSGRAGTAGLQHAFSSATWARQDAKFDALNLQLGAHLQEGGRHVSRKYSDVGEVEDQPPRMWPEATQRVQQVLEVCLEVETSHGHPVAACGKDDCGHRGFPSERPLKGGVTASSPPWQLVPPTLIHKPRKLEQLCPPAGGR
jgi:hypothetical protein